VPGEARPFRDREQDDCGDEEGNSDRAHASRIVSRPRESSGMKRGALIGVLLALAASGCAPLGSTTTVTLQVVPPTTPTNPHMPVPPMTLTVFAALGGVLHPIVAHVPQTRAVATAALHSLGLDAPVTIVNGTATVDLPDATDAQIASIVYTLTQFRSIQRVDVAGRHGLTRDDFASYVPPIFVESPAADATVPQTFSVSGTASVVEGTLTVELVRNGKVLSTQTVTASAGAPDRGPFTATLHATPGVVTVETFAPSAADGSHQHEVDVPVTVSP
jgi:hypothetical protein